MNGKESLKEELGGLSPKLLELKRKGDGFSAPSDYFASLESTVFARLEESGIQRQGMRVVRGKKWYQRFGSGPMLAAAASLTLVFSAWWFLKPETGEAFQPPAVVAASPLTAEDLEGYLIDHVQSLDSDQLADLDDVEPGAEESVAPSEHHPHKHPITSPGDDLTPEDLENALKDMSEEELEQLL
jgi:hypothetical protein